MMVKTSFAPRLSPQKLSGLNKDYSGESTSVIPTHIRMGFMHIPIFLTFSVLLDQPFYHLFHSMDTSFMFMTCGMYTICAVCDL